MWIATPAAWLSVPAWAVPASLEADRLAIDGDVARGDGDVRLVVGDDVVTGASAELRLEDNVVIVLDGAWTRPDLGTLRFERVEIDLDTRVGEALAATIDGADGGLRIAGDRLVVDGDGRVRGDRVAVTLCDCAEPVPWRLRARRIVVEPGDVVRFSGAWVQVFGVPLLWVPAGTLPLERRSGLLPTQLGGGEHGLRVAQPLYLTMGPSADVTLTPEIRSRRAARLLSDWRWAHFGGGGGVRTAAGWDFVTETPRGGVDAVERWRDGAVHAAADARLVSDDAYHADYGDTFLARHTPWSEARGLVGTTGLELGSDVFQAPAPTLQRVAFAAARAPGWLGPGGVVATAAATGGVGLMPGDDTGAAAALAGLSGRVSRPTSLGPVRIEPDLRARADAIAWDGPDGAATTTTRGEAAVLGALPAWRDTPGGFERVELAARGGVVGDGATAAPFVEPRLGWRRSTRPGSVELVGRGRFGDVAAAEAVAWARTGRVSGWAQLGAVGESVAAVRDLDADAVASTGAAYDDGTVRVDGGWFAYTGDASAIPVHQARGSVGWTLPGPLSTLRVGGGAAYDLQASAFQSRWASLRYTHPTGCIALGATGRFDADRALPEVAFTAEVLPRRPAP